MNPKAAIVFIALIAAVSQQDAGRPDPAPLPPPAAKVARDFLFAFSSNDRDAIASMLPRQLENLYGACAFARTPDLTNPRADTRVAAVDFNGPMADAGLPAKGTMVLRLVEEDGVRAWRVRQIYWYDRLPPEAHAPDRSPTAADRQQEPKVLRAAADFVQAWLDSDYQTMDRLTFHWWEVPRRPPKWVKMTGANLTALPTSLDGLRVDFVAKLRVARILPRSVRGNLWLIEEDGVWRVRPLVFTFAF